MNTTAAVMLGVAVPLGVFGIAVFATVWAAARVRQQTPGPYEVSR